MPRPPWSAVLPEKVLLVTLREPLTPPPSPLPALAPAPPLAVLAVRALLVMVTMPASFGATKPLDEITAGGADGTTGRTVKRAKQFFRAPVRKEVITKNPFVDAKPPSMVNQARKFFVTQETAYKVLESCPTPNGACCSLSLGSVVYVAHPNAWL